MDCFGTLRTHVQTCHVTRVQSATEWTASVHSAHMSKPNVTCVQSATEWTASVHSAHMSKPNVTRVQSASNGLLRYKMHTCPNLYAWVWHLPKNANFKVELAKICWPSSVPAVPKKEAANSTCRNTIAVKSTKHKLSLKTHGLLPTRDHVYTSHFSMLTLCHCSETANIRSMFVSDSQAQSVKLQ